MCASGVAVITPLDLPKLADLIFQRLCVRERAWRRTVAIVF
jgi:hypothetical protein